MTAPRRPISEMGRDELEAYAEALEEASGVSAAQRIDLDGLPSGAVRALLGHLLELPPGAYATRAALVGVLSWDQSEPIQERNISTRIGELRRVLEHNGWSGSTIENARGYGWRLAPRVHAELRARFG